MFEETNFWKVIVLEFIDFIRFKVEQDSLTIPEYQSIVNAIGEKINLKGTTDDFARFYGKTKTNVTTVIDRKMLPKPERCLLHSFSDFQKAKPKSWDFTIKDK